MDISELLLFVHKEGASDLHISAGEPPMARIHGEMRRIEMPALSKDDVHVMLYDVLSDQQRKRFEENFELDFSIELKGIARVSCQRLSPSPRRRRGLPGHPFQDTELGRIGSS